MTLIQIDDFKAGVFKDVAPHLIPDDGVEDAWNVLFDYGQGTGKIRRRNAAKLSQAVDHDAPHGSIGYYRNHGIDDSRGLYGARNLSTALVLSYISENGSVTYNTSYPPSLRIGKAFNYFDNLCIPIKSRNTCPLLGTYGGSHWPQGGALSSAAAVQFATPGTAIITSGDSRIPIATGDTDLPYVGMYFIGYNGTDSYCGRITNVSKNYIEVNPTPNFTLTPTNAAVFEIFNVATGAGSNIAGAGAGDTHQGRIVLGDLMLGNSGTGRFQDEPSYIAWGLLPDETSNVSGIAHRGLHNLFFVGYDVYNRFPVPNAGHITSLQSINDDELLILASGGVYVLNGSLPSLTVEGGSITFDTRQISRTINCTNDATVQHVSGGVIWANHDSVYMYDGSGINDLMKGKLKDFYHNIISKSGVTVQGAAFVDNKYYMLSTSDRCFVFSFDSGAWSFFDNMEFDSSAIDVENGKVFAARAGTATYRSERDQLFRLDTIFDDNESISADYNYREIETLVRTKSYSLESIINKHFKHVSALTQLKKASNVNSIGFMNNFTDVLDLPNAGAEQGTTAHWYVHDGSGGLPDLLTVDTANERSGTYCIKVDTTANNQGLRYNLPSMWMNTTDTVAVEIWVKCASGTPIVTLNIGHTGDVGGTTITGSTSYQVIRGTWSPVSNGHKTGLFLAVHISTTVDFYVDDLTSCVFGQIERIANNNGLVSGASLYIDTEHSLESSCMLVTTQATALQGFSYKHTATIPENSRLIAKVKVRNLSSAQQWVLSLGYGAALETTTTTITPSISVFTEYTLTGNVAVATHQSGYISVFSNSAVIRNLLVQEIKLYVQDMGGGITFVGGMNAEGSIGDGKLFDTFDGTLADTYEITGSGISNSNGVVTIASTPGKWLRSKRSKSAKFKSGEIGIKLNLGTWAAETEGPSLSLNMRASLEGNAYQAQILQNDINIREILAFTGLISATNAAITTLESGKIYWLRYKLQARKAKLYLYDVPYHDYNEFYLDKYTTLEEGRVEYVHNVSGELDEGLAGFSTSPMSADALDETYDDFYINPYDTIQLKEANETEPTFDRTSPYLISKAGAFEFRSWGGADLNIFGIGINAELLNSEREN